MEHFNHSPQIVQLDGSTATASRMSKRDHSTAKRSIMNKSIFVAILLSAAAVLVHAQAISTAANTSASATTATPAKAKNKLLSKLKGHKRGADAVNPEASPFKKGGS